MICWDEDLRFAGVQSAAECGSEAPNGGRFVVEIVFKLYETQSRRLETTNFVGCKRPRHQSFFLVHVSPACNHQQEPARCDEVCNPDDRPLSLTLPPPAQYLAGTARPIRLRPPGSGTLEMAEFREPLREFRDMGPVGGRIYVLQLIGIGVEVVQFARAGPVLDVQLVLGPQGQDHVDWMKPVSMLPI